MIALPTELVLLRPDVEQRHDCALSRDNAFDSNRIVVQREVASVPRIQSSNEGTFSNSVQSGEQQLKSFLFRLGGTQWYFAVWLFRGTPLDKAVAQTAVPPWSKFSSKPQNIRHFC